MRSNITSRIAMGLAAFLACGPSVAATAEGRWIKECEGGSNCRLLITKVGSKYDFNYMITNPDHTQRFETCEWTARMTMNKKTGILKTSGGAANFQAVIKNNHLVVSGNLPDKCGQRPAKEVFSVDHVDEFDDY